LLALDLNAGDEVIMPCFTIISCSNAVIRAGALPVLVDSDPITWNMDVDQIKNKITKNTKAIMVVHIYGLPVDMDPVLDLANKYHLHVIEDNAEGIGQEYKCKPCGGFGTISIHSFYPNKHITTGEGGMITTDSTLLADKCRSYRNLCFQPNNRFVHEEMGFNYRMTNMQAAVGLAQLEQLSETIKKKRLIGEKYNQLLLNVPHIQLPLPQDRGSSNIYWVYGVVLKDSCPYGVSDIRSLLLKEGVDSRPFFWGLHEQPVYKNMGLFIGEKYPITEKISRRGFYLPSGVAMTDKQIDKSAEELRRILLDV